MAVPDRLYYEHIKNTASLRTVYIQNDVAQMVRELQASRMNKSHIIPVALIKRIDQL